MRKNIRTEIKRIRKKSYKQETVFLASLFAGKYFITNIFTIFCEWHLSFRLKKNFCVREINQGKETENFKMYCSLKF